MSVGIYRIKNLITNESYVGQSKNIETRIQIHKNSLNRGDGSNRLLQESWNNYGEENFSFETMSNCYIDELDEMETLFLNKETNVFNLQSGGKQGFEVSEETKKILSEKGKGRIVSEITRQKLREANSGNNCYNFGKELSEETKEKIRKGNEGKNVSQETRERMSKAFTGRRYSEEAKRKNSEARIKSGASKGENNPKAKLTETKVAEIKRKLKEGQKITSLSQEFNVSNSTIKSIKTGRTWSNVEEVTNNE